MTRRFVRFATLGAVLFLATAAHPNWTATVTETPVGSHVLGNPAARVKLVEIVSYTCPHCADFARRSETPLRIAYVTPGKVSVEVRHLVRDPVDLAAAMLTNCGAPARFFRNHNAFMFGQGNWIVRAQSASKAQQSRWQNGPLAQRMRAIATDFGFYAIMEQRGYSRGDTDKCLADVRMAQRLTAQSQAAAEAGVQGTPAFMLDGILLTGTHDWTELEPQIKARL